MSYQVSNPLNPFLTTSLIELCFYHCRTLGSRTGLVDKFSYSALSTSAETVFQTFFHYDKVQLISEVLFSKTFLRTYHMANTLKNIE